MESFFSTLKSELVNREKFETEEEARRRIYDNIEVYYSRQRRQSMLMSKSNLDWVSTLSGQDQMSG